MSDDFELVRRLRPDALQPAHPGDPAVYAIEKERLMSAITPSFDYTGLATPDIYPRLAYRDEYAAIEYLCRVFQFVEQREARLEHDGHCLAWLRMGSGVVMLGHVNEDFHHIFSPMDSGLTTAIVNVYVHDVDAHYAHAQREGATISVPLADEFYGERRYEAADLEGHRWHFGERFADIVARGGRPPEQ